eukprot:CAMPEP_0178370092 /NCGR_PEP_ID=MMETSP0689_2-20121128/118_1 /TAXON_ID=160604 /ORGANISM="Amphidinium massartii, Strain CS-259" /LENGTH=36 /DNA_ID= /DNA_START= /DNA_END= /DNA_ORIENTATION=
MVEETAQGSQMITWGCTSVHHIGGLQVKVVQQEIKL